MKEARLRRALSTCSREHGRREGENILVLTDVPTAEDWIKESNEKLTDMIQRSVLAKTVSEIAREKFPG